jgi:hypothetical protein
MSGLDARHIREMPLESSLEARYAWLTREKAERLDMSSLGTGHVWPRGGHVRRMPLESDLRAGYVLLAQEKVERLDMSVLGARHVWPEGQICPARVSRIWLEGGYVWPDMSF